jgi:hypothetical protein
MRARAGDEERGRMDDPLTAVEDRDELGRALVDLDDAATLAAFVRDRGRRRPATTPTGQCAPETVATTAS